MAFKRTTLGDYIVNVVDIQGKESDEFKILLDMFGLIELRKKYKAAKLAREQSNLVFTDAKRAAAGDMD